MSSRGTIVLIVYFIQGSLGHALPQSPIVGIIGGHTVDIEHVPFMAYIRIGDYACGGSIIHERFVLTAAHCVLSNHSDFDYVRVGSSRKNGGGKKYSISRYISHEHYIENDDKPDEYDLGLLKLSTILTFGSSVAPIVLADSNLEIYPGMKAVVFGWGLIGPNMTTNELHLVTVSVASPSYCMAHNKIWMSDKNICVTEIGGGACDGDSGGPLVAGGRQIGIDSARYGPCGYTPGYYVNVAAHTKWIHDQLVLNA